MQTQTLHARKHCVPAYQASISRQKLTDLGVESESHWRPSDGHNNIDLYDHDQGCRKHQKVGKGSVPLLQTLLNHLK